MKDHIWTPGDGRRVPVSEMPTEVIVEHLQCGIDITNMQSGVTEADVKKRLELELFIRQQGWRA